MPADRIIETDVLVIGGGVAGLWVLANARRAGFRALLVEEQALGTGQTIASQGIIHGGLKYALSGEATAAARAIAEMPAAWAEAIGSAARIGGEGAVEVPPLQGVPVLSPCQWIWTTSGVLSRLAGLGASRAIRTPVVRVPPAERPAVFAGAPATIDVYRVGEPVLPVAGVIRALARLGQGALMQARVERAERRGGSGWSVACAAEGTGTVAIHAVHVVLCAGPGNALLAPAFGLTGATMQRRPLHMVMARGALPEVFGHCVGASTVPRLTVTTARPGEGAERVWWIGGGLAEEGVGLDEATQRARARQEVQTCLPWVDVSMARWSTLRIDRAEGLDRAGRRPDTPVIHTQGGATVVWPTKLAFAPLVGAEVVAALRGAGVPARGESEPLSGFPVPGVAIPPWDEPARVWHGGEGA
ncbi:MAG: FAD-dependent oxidoreductase [Phycisphaerales bacterium]